MSRQFCTRSATFCPPPMSSPRRWTRRRRTRRRWRGSWSRPKKVEFLTRALIPTTLAESPTEPTNMVARTSQFRTNQHPAVIYEEGEEEDEEELSNEAKSELRRSEEELGRFELGKDRKKEEGQIEKE